MPNILWGGLPVRVLRRWKFSRNASGKRQAWQTIHDSEKMPAVKGKAVRLLCLEWLMERMIGVGTGQVLCIPHFSCTDQCNCVPRQVMIIVIIVGALGWGRIRGSPLKEEARDMTAIVTLSKRCKISTGHRTVCAVIGTLGSQFCSAYSFKLWERRKVPFNVRIKMSFVFSPHIQHCILKNLGLSRNTLYSTAQYCSHIILPVG